MARGSFGERLKRERELREVSLEELTKATRIGSRFLNALENEEWEKLPGGVFGRGFVRSIAQYLGLDEESLLGDYDLARGEQASATLQTYESDIPFPPTWVYVLIAFGVLIVLAGLILGGIFGWRHYSAHRAAKHARSTSALPSLFARQCDFAASSAASRSLPTPCFRFLAQPDFTLATSAAIRIRLVTVSELLLGAELPAGETRRPQSASGSTSFLHVSRPCCWN